MMKKLILGLISLNNIKLKIMKIEIMVKLIRIIQFPIIHKGLEEKENIFDNKFLLKIYLKLILII